MNKKNNVLSMAGKNRGEDRRRKILRLFLEDNPAFEVCLRNLQDRNLPDNDRIALKLYKGEPLAAQIERYCLNLQSVLFTLSVFPKAKIPDEVLDGFFEMAGEGVPGLRCARSGRRSSEINMEVIGRQKVPALALLRFLRGGRDDTF